MIQKRPKKCVPGHIIFVSPGRIAPAKKRKRKNSWSNQTHAPACMRESISGVFLLVFELSPHAHWLSWSRGEEQGQMRHGVPRSSQRCKSHEGTAHKKEGGKRSRAYVGCLSTVLLPRGTTRETSSRSGEAPVNKLTFNESERVASGSPVACN